MALWSNLINDFALVILAAGAVVVLILLGLAAVISGRGSRIKNDTKEDL